MARSRSSPLALEVLTDIPTGEGQLKGQIDKLVLSIKNTDEQMRGWLDQQMRLMRLRYADRYPRDVPWQGASNISVPLIDGIIRRWKPGIAALILDAEPVAYMSPQESSDVDVARLAEQFFHFLFTVHMDPMNELMLLVDLIAQRGHAYAREGWRYRTAREVRIVNVDDLFPGGIEATINAAAQQYNATTQPGNAAPFDPRDLVVQTLVQEYELDINDPEEGKMLAEAATRIVTGAKYVRLTYRRVTEDRPEWRAIDPIDVIVPVDDEPETARFFAFIHTWTPERIRDGITDGHFRPDAAQRVIKSANENSESKGSAAVSDRVRRQIRDLMNQRAGISPREGTTRAVKPLPNISIWEIFAKIDINGDGVDERCILFYAPEHDEVLSFTEYPFPFDSWPITSFRFSTDQRRLIDVRGMAQLLKPYQKIVNSFHNARIDASEILLAPVMQMRGRGGGSKRQLKWRPGAVFQVQEIGDIQPIPQDLRILDKLLQEEQVNQRLAEAYIGVFDATIQSIAGRERRTAREISAITDVSSSIFGMDAKTFVLSMSKSFNKVWDLYLDFGPPEMFFRVQNEQLPKLARKSEIGRRYDIRASGTPSNTNRQLVLATMEHMMQLLLSNPVVLQSGRVDIGEVLDTWAKLLDYKMAKRFIRSPENATAVQQILQAATAVSGQEAAPF